MRFWLVDPWDALPGEIGIDRGMHVARALLDRGHEVVWWQTGFSHAEKKFRAEKHTTLQPEPRLKIILLPCRSYRTNVSPARLLSVADFAWQFTRRHSREPAADAVLISGPIFFAEFTFLHLKWVRRIPLIFEFRDLWPEAIVQGAKGGKRLLLQVALSGFVALRRLLIRNSAAVLGLNRTYMEIGRREAGMRPDMQFAVAYPAPKMTPVQPASRPADRAEIWAISSGTLGASHDHRVLLSAAARLKVSHPQLRFFITGSGPHAGEIADIIAAESLDNVRFLGALPGAKFHALLGQCDIGLALYRSFSPVVFPTKIVDYLLAGLAIVTSAQGEGGEMLLQARAGCAVEAENAAQLATVLGQLAEDRQGLLVMQQNSVRFGQEFTHDRQIAVITRLLENVGRQAREKTPVL